MIERFNTNVVETIIALPFGSLERFKKVTRENIEEFIIKLETLYPQIKYVNRLMTHSWGQKVIRFYDLDGNLIEVGTPVI